MEGKDRIRNKKPEDRRYSFFQHTSCEFFPCHKTEHPEDFNCLFCYCPLYALGKDCGGNLRYTSSGTKDCTLCLVPHERDSLSYIASKFPQIKALTDKNES